MSSPSAYLLVSHGSSDARHQAGLSRLADLMRQQLDRSLREEIPAESLVDRHLASRQPAYPLPSVSQAAPRQALCLRRSAPPQRTPLPTAPAVGTATLELAPVPLSEQILAFAERVSEQGCRQVVIVPLFLLPGVHVQEDLPAEIQAARTRLPMHMRLLCASYIGGQTAFKRFVAARLKATQADRCLLLSHGSRRKAGNRSVQQLAAILDTDVAFWKVPPDLETKVIELMQQGHRHIAIAPYFLFPGSLTDAVTRRTEALAERLPKLSIRLLSPLGASTDLGRVVTEVALATLSPVQASPRWQERWQVSDGSITA